MIDKKTKQSFVQTSSDEDVLHGSSDVCLDQAAKMLAEKSAEMDATLTPKKSGKKRIVVLFAVIVIAVAIFCFLYFQRGGNVVDDGGEKNTIVSSCKINTSLLSSIGFMEYWDTKINLEKEDDITSKAVLSCDVLSEDDASLLDVVKGNISVLFEADVDTESNTIVLTGLNEGYIKNSVVETYLRGDSPVFIHKSNSPFIINFRNLFIHFKGYYGIADYEMREQTTVERIKFNSLFNKYGDDIIVSNYRFYLNINEVDKGILKNFGDDSFKKLVELESIFNNAFVEKDSFIILKNIADVLKAN